MSANELAALLPLIVVAATSVVVMLWAAARRSHRASMLLTAFGLLLGFITAALAAGRPPVQVTPLIIVDQYALFYMGLIFAVSFFVAIISYGYLEGRVSNADEYYILLLLATLGAGVMVAASHFVSLFLGLEILSVALYVLIAYVRTGDRGIEAGLKYLILAAVSAGFLVFGMALVYAEMGTMEFGKMAAMSSGGASLLLLAGLGMIVVGAGFKLAVVPFHMWTPDVYEGAPAPVTAFVATASKGGMIALLLRYFHQTNGYSFTSVMLAFTIIAIASMFVGNLLALLQKNVKRILAYSSIAHLGYVLVAFVAASEMAAVAVAFYLVAYFVTTVSAFAIVTVMSGNDGEADDIEDYRGLFWRRPCLAALFTASLLSLAGIPLTAGFVGKFYVVASGIGSALWLMVAMLVINSTISVYYYLRVVVTMFSPVDEAAPRMIPALSLSGSVALAALGLLLVWFGVYPAPLMRLLQATVATLI